MTHCKRLPDVFVLCRESVVRGGVVGQGLRGLVGGVTAGVTGVVRAPLQGYSDGTGLIAGSPLILICSNASMSACPSKPAVIIEILRSGICCCCSGQLSVPSTLPDVLYRGHGCTAW